VESASAEQAGGFLNELAYRESGGEGRSQTAGKQGRVFKPHQAMIAKAVTLKCEMGGCLGGLALGCNYCSGWVPPVDTG